MKTIGLLGGLSWESSREYYRIINEAVRERLGGLHSAACLLYSLDFAQIERFQQQDRWDEAGALLSQAAQRLEQAGADLLLICANTMHRVAPAIQARLRIPVLHIADPTAQAIKARGMQTVGLLGTRFIMEHAFYRERLEGVYGLNILVPPKAERLAVHAIIYQELVRGVITTQAKRRLQKIMAGLSRRGAEGIVLGCTEFMLLIRPDDAPVPTFDTTTLHALAAVELALAGPPQRPSAKAP